MTDRELMKQALDAWIDFSETTSQRDGAYPEEIQIDGYRSRWGRLEAAMDVLRERLEPPCKTGAQCVRNKCPQCDVPEQGPIKASDLFGEFIYGPTAEKTAAHQKMVAETVRMKEPVAGYVWEEWTKEKSPWGTEEWVQTYGYFPPDTERPFRRNVRALYAAPPRREWVGMTDEDIDGVKHTFDWASPWTFADYARAIEAKLKEKNA